ncbi:hypothetical protein CUC08_Gglean008819 [Alternaria sp. MG1]|nr:hypothetical protein CUC08_Gglean008819 [Alternaria sp. MG1]
MATASATMSTNPIATTPSLHPPFTSRDRLRFALFLIIPVYAQLCILPSISSTLKHIYIVGTTGICIIQFSGDLVGGELINLGLVWDIVYGLAISRFPHLSKSYSLTAWIIPEIEGWRGTVIQWAIMLRSLMYLLPENYGSKVEVILANYKDVHSRFGKYVGIFSLFVTITFLESVLNKNLGPVDENNLKEYLETWHKVLVVWWILCFFIEYLCIVRLNYIHLCRYGIPVRFKLWPHKVVVKASQNHQGQIVIEEELQ